ncbi:MAG: FAD-dependent oxidoreductase [Acidimicrobiia bacterium]|nr:FAD-dependent oxidoreductase [Acidimicrobiia bacterium]
MITGAILAGVAGMKVLVLEKEPIIGGRVVSFGGPHGTYSATEYRDLLAGCAGLRIVDSEPSLAQIVDGGLFEQHILDGGWHGVSAGDRCRYSTLARYFGKRIDVDPQVGLLYHRDGDWVEMRDVADRWPKESVRERTRVAAERALISNAEAAEFNHVGLRSYLELVTDDENVRDYYAVLAKFQMGVNDVERISAGDWIMCNNMTSASGRHLSLGGGMGDVRSGFKSAVDTFAEVIRESGGEIRTGARVDEVIIERHRAQGVVVEEAGRRSRVDARFVVSNLPMNRVFRIVPEETFPAELVERIKAIFPMPGLLGHVKLRQPIETRFPKGMFVLDGLEGPKLRGDATVYGFEQTSIIDPTRQQGADGCLLQTWVGMSAKDPDEIHDQAVVREVMDAKFAFMREQYPGFDDLVEWYIMVAAPAVYGVHPGPGLTGDRRPPVRHPLVRNLFFTGDTVTQTDVGTNGAAHGAVLCASAVADRDFRVLLPPAMR